MFPFTKTLQTDNITKWVNTDQFIILHHTATQPWTIKWVLNTLTKWNVSCHFVVDVNGDIYKIWDPKDILWHCWNSEWGSYKMMNNYSMWIEVVWPDLNVNNRKFSEIQFEKTTELVKYLMKEFHIWMYNILRHKDITHYLSASKVLSNPWISSRKIDILDCFFPWKDFEKWRKEL